MIQTQHRMEPRRGTADSRFRLVVLLLIVLAAALLAAGQGPGSMAGDQKEKSAMSQENLARAAVNRLPPIDLWKPGKTGTAIFALG